MADDYDTMREELTDIGYEASSVFETILAQPDETAEYAVIEDRLSRFDVDEQEVRRVTDDLQDRGYIETTDDGIRMTNKAERFLEEDTGSLEDYRRSLKIGHAFQLVDEYVDATLPYDLDAAYDEVVADAVDDAEPLNLVANVLGHPRYAPSMEELDYLNSDTDRETLEERYEALEVDGVTVSADDGEHTYHRLTEDAVAYMADQGFLGKPAGTAIGTRQAIQQMGEKPDYIEELERQERPAELWEGLSAGDTGD